MTVGVAAVYFMAVWNGAIRAERLSSYTFSCPTLGDAAVKLQAGAAARQYRVAVFCGLALSVTSHFAAADVVVSLRQRDLPAEAPTWH